MDVEVQGDFAGSVVEPAREPVVGVRRRRERAVDAPEALARGLCVDLRDEALVVAGHDLPARVVEPRLAVALRHLPLGRRRKVVHLGALPGVRGANRRVATGVALLRRPTEERGFREFRGVGRVEPLVQDGEAAGGGARVELGGPRIEEVEDEREVVGVGALEARLGDVPHAQPGVELLHRRPVHAEAHVELEVWLAPRLVHLIAGEQRHVGAHGVRLERLSDLRRARQVVPAHGAAVLGAEAACDVRADPVPLHRVRCELDVLKQQRDHRPWPLLERLAIDLERFETKGLPVCVRDLELGRDEVRLLVRSLVACGAGVAADEGHERHQLRRQLASHVVGERRDHGFEMECVLRIQVIAVDVRAVGCLPHALVEQPRRDAAPDRSTDGLDLDTERLVLIGGELQLRVECRPIEQALGGVHGGPDLGVALPAEKGVFGERLIAGAVPHAVRLAREPHLATVARGAPRHGGRRLLGVGQR